MIITIPDVVLQQALADVSDAGFLGGQLLDDGDVAQIVGLAVESQGALGSWVKSDLASPGPTLAAEGSVLLLVYALPEPGARGFVRAAGEWAPAKVEVVRPHADYTARLQGLFELDLLAAARVAIIGLGSGGSLIASQLARCGIGRMRLVDHDRLETHNIARHACGLRDIGRYKTRAVRDLLVSISPIVQVETFEADVVKQSALLEAIVADCDLVVAATDSEGSKLAINQACWPRGIPAVYGAAYNRAFGGDVFRALPSDGACYDCFHHAVAGFFGPPPVATDLGPGYSDPQRMADLVAQPGLPIDVGVIALLVARAALATLGQRESNNLLGWPENWLLFGNRAEWAFQKPLESLFIDIPKRDTCPTCNYDAYVRRHLGISVEEARAQAQALLAQLPSS